MGLSTLSEASSAAWARKMGDVLHVHFVTWRPPGKTVSPQTTGTGERAQTPYREARRLVRAVLQALIGLHSPFSDQEENFLGADSCEFPRL